MKYFSALLLVILTSYLHAQQQKPNNTFEDIVDLSISLKAEALGSVANLIIAVLNSCDDENNDCEDNEDEVAYIKMIFGGETKVGFNINPLLLSGGYDLLSIPKDVYGKEIIGSTFFVESQIDLSSDGEQSPYFFGQIGRTSFSLKQLIPHWRYTMGIGYKGEHVGLDVGYNFFNNPEEQQQEFLINDTELFKVEDSFLKSGFVTLRLTFEIL
ncbi:hypothetical protein [uncultured Winogradskyella sp.]|uniref:hypothetical protein n=1 Tax=uncultured Winogradskyella sp. TaxID=395353 RepID=UPI002612C2BA|nr:hypothetical protein [uncultured Winogradskyella sp.]